MENTGLTLLLVVLTRCKTWNTFLKKVLYAQRLNRMQGFAKKWATSRGPLCFGDAVRIERPQAMWSTEGTLEFKVGCLAYRWVVSGLARP